MTGFLNLSAAADQFGQCLHTFVKCPLEGKLPLDENNLFMIVMIFQRMVIIILKPLNNIEIIDNCLVKHVAGSIFNPFVIFNFISNRCIIYPGKNQTLQFSILTIPSSHSSETRTSRLEYILLGAFARYLYIHIHL